MGRADIGIVPFLVEAVLMLSQLIESGRKTRRHGPHSFLSLAFHVALGFGAIAASKEVVEPATTPKVDTQMVFTPAEPSTTVSHHVTDLPTSSVVEPTPNQFAAPVAPIDIPVGIPPVELGRPAEPGRFVPAPGEPGCGTCPTGRDSLAVFTEGTVDEPVEAVTQPRPVYPRGLESMGVAGRVSLEFVVTTAGMVEPGSIHVLEASHAAFGASATQAIEGSVFRPARVRGVPVKQLVRQVIRFEAGR